MQATFDIQLENLSVGYGDNIVLEELNVVFPAKNLSVILGSSGCGKSTLLRHIIGLNRPLSGKILLEGKDIFSLPTQEFKRIRRRFGVLFQDGALLGSLNLADNVVLPLAEHTNLSKEHLAEAAHKALSLVHLEDFAHYFPNQLSGGMRKRAGLARAIITEPHILLCDEPTSGLDPITAAQMDQLLMDMRHNFPDMTIIIVSHDLASLAKIADFALVLKDKKAIFSGTYEDLQKSDNSYLQQFLNRQSGEHKEAKTIAYSPIIKKEIQKWLDS